MLQCVNVHKAYCMHARTTLYVQNSCRCGSFTHVVKCHWDPVTVKACSCVKPDILSTQSICFFRFTPFGSRPWMCHTDFESVPWVFGVLVQLACNLETLGLDGSRHHSDNPVKKTQHTVSVVQIGWKCAGGVPATAQGETQTHGFQQTINTDMHAGERELILDTSEHFVSLALKAFYYLLCFTVFFNC